MPGGKPLLEMVAVSFRYRDGRGRGLHGVDIALQPGEWVALAGANGSGKSTFLRLAAGLLRPGAGSVRYEGREMGASAAAQGIGFLTQHPEEHVLGLTVWEDVAFGPSQQGLSGDALAARVRFALEAVDLGRRAGAAVNTLSGGELQRLALAGVLALRPRLFLLDEPTANADPTLRRMILRAVRRQQEESGATVVWATHRAEEIRAADRVLVFHEGRIVYAAAPEALSDDDERCRVWGVPPLFASSAGTDRGEEEGSGRTNGEHGLCLLEFQGVGFSYREGEECHQVLHGVDLQLEPGETALLTGESGAGKSTLLQIAGLLLRHQSGRLVVLDEEVPPVGGAHTRAERSRFTLLEGRLRADLAVAFQEPEKQFFALTVEDEFRFTLRQMGVPPAEWRHRSIEALSAVGMDAAEILSCSPFHLSGGERRRVAIALGIAMHPKLFLLDEPTAALDFQGESQVLAAVDRLRRETGCALLVATHDVDRFSDRHFRWFHLAQGSVVKRDPLYEFSEGEMPTKPEPPISVASAMDEVADGEAETRRWLKSVDPRIRLVGTLSIAVAIAFVAPGRGLAVAGAVVLTLLFLARYPASRVFATAKGLAPFLGAAILFAAIGRTSDGLVFSHSGLYEGLQVATRVLLMVIAVSWLPWVGGIGEMMGALRSLAAPLRRLGLPWDGLSAATLVGMRMLPVLRDETRNLRLAQAARGVHFGGGLRGRWNRLASLVIPLTVAVLRRADRLGEALQVRGLVGEASPWVGHKAPRRHLGGVDQMFIVFALISLVLLAWIR